MSLDYLKRYTWYFIKLPFYAFYEIFNYFYKSFLIFLGDYNIYYSSYYTDLKIEELNDSIEEEEEDKNNSIILFKQPVIQKNIHKIIGVESTLHYACKHNSVIIIEEALKNPKVIESLEKHQYKGIHLLIISYYHENFDIVQTLLKCDVIRNNIHLRCEGLVIDRNKDSYKCDLYQNALYLSCRYGDDSLVNEIMIKNQNNPVKIEGQVLSGSLLEALRQKHKSTVDILLTYPEVLEKIYLNSTQILQTAIFNRYIDKVDQLLKIDVIQDLLETQGNNFILNAIDGKSPEIVEKLLEFQSVRKNIHLNNNAIFLCLILGKYEDLAIRIWQQYSEVRTTAIVDRSLSHACSEGLKNLVQIMLKDDGIIRTAARNNNQAYEWAIRNSHEDIAIILWQNENVKNNVSSNRYLAFRLACEKGLIEIVKFMLEEESVRNNAATENNQAYEQAEINGHVGITRLLTEQCPAVNRYLNENRTENTQNEILYANNHKESAMASLTMQEEDQLNEIIGEYLNLSQNEIETSFQDLLKFLDNEYLQDPAKIHVNNEELTLPLTWNEFMNLKKDKKFQAETYTKALKAYWNHQPHAKLRYFLEPNMWMHPDAQYVTRTIRNNQLTATADFKEYKDLIAQLWRVACGKDEDTKLNFTAAFYDLNRAYNQIDRAHNPLGSHDVGDKPNCSYGVRRRLYLAACFLSSEAQINEDTLNTYIHAFIKNHYVELYKNLEINEKVHLINLIEDNLSIDSSDVESIKIIEKIEKINDNTDMLNYYNTLYLKCNPKSQASLFELATKKNIIVSNITTDDAKTREYDKTLQDYNISDDTVKDCINGIQQRFINNQSKEEIFKEQHKNYIFEKFVLNAGEYHLIKFFSSCNLKNIFYLEDNEINNTYSSCSLSMSN